jgi:hypothetical protein
MLDTFILLFMLIGLPLDWCLEKIGFQHRSMDSRYKRPFYCGIVSTVGIIAGAVALFW